MDTSVLKSKDGKFVEIQDVDGQLKLCVVERQNEKINAPLVEICRRSNNNANEMALKFQHRSVSYSLKVDEKHLTLESAVDGTHLDNSYWFKKEDNGSGEHYGLRSVVEPSYCLYVRKKDRYRIFSLSDDKSRSALVTDENKK